MVVSNSSSDASSNDAPDLFRNESEALEKSRAIHAIAGADAEDYRQALGELIGHFERLMRETRRLIGRSDRAEREMHALTRQLQYRATHDALTEVFNRSAVIERTIKALRADTPADSKGAGLGFLTMARDASEPLEFAFHPRADEPGTTLFCLKTII